MGHDGSSAPERRCSLVPTRRRTARYPATAATTVSHQTTTSPEIGLTTADGADVTPATWAYARRGGTR